MAIDNNTLAAILATAQRAIPVRNNTDHLVSSAIGRSDAYQAGVLVNPPFVTASDFVVSGGGAGGAVAESSDGTRAAGGSIYTALNGTASDKIAGIPTDWLIIGAVAVGAFLLLSKPKKGGA